MANPTLAQLLELWTDDALSDDQFAHLADLLEHDASARAEFIRIQDQEANLYWDYSDTRSASGEPLAASSQSLATDDSLEPSRPAGRAMSWLDRASRNPKGPAIAIAATLLIAALVVMGLIPVKDWIAGGGKAKPEEQEPGVKQEFVAKLSNWHNDVWLDDTRPPRDDPRLKIGRRLKIESGLIEVTYLTGARVVIEGPAEFWVGGTEAEGTEAQREQDNRGTGPSHGRKPADFANSGFLSLGKLVARVEGEKAQGFSIDTPSGSVEDLGTEFGLVVSRHGAVDIHVFDGSVRISSSQPDGAWQGEVTLVEKQSLRVGPGASQPLQSMVDPKVFAATRSLRQTIRAEAEKEDTIAYWRFEQSVPAPGPEWLTQRDVIRDDAGRGLTLDYWPGRAGGIGPFPSGDDVPPESMFREGHDGGRRSFNFGKVDPQKAGVLFFDAFRHGPQLSFRDDFTIEGFFKTDGDRKKAGEMDILLHDRSKACYWIRLNEQAPGGFRFGLAGSLDGASKSIGVELTGKNFADGTWHYFVVQYDLGVGARPSRAIAEVIDERGNRHRGVVSVDSGFTISTSMEHTYIGRQKHVLPTAGSFVGWIDEIRISRGLRKRNQLLGDLSVSANAEQH